MNALAVTIRQGDEGEQRWFCGGGLHTWKVTESDSGGAFLMWESLEEGGKATPLHLHADADETFHLLEGAVVLYLDNEERSVRTGGVAVVPRGVPHAFKVTSPHARMLWVHTPGGGEAFYRVASDPVIPGEGRPPVNFGRVKAAAESTGGAEILGPPPE
ncbi:MAG: cupin domain-containing protein [Ramlibacter sp.]|nr:cupin domain-containing protein [Cryobacterium sp.]